jgi:hypothetical protein
MGHPIICGVSKAILTVMVIGALVGTVMVISAMSLKPRYQPAWHRSLDSAIRKANDLEHTVRLLKEEAESLHKEMSK